MLAYKSLIKRGAYNNDLIIYVDIEIIREEYIMSCKSRNIIRVLLGTVIASVITCSNENSTEPKVSGPTSDFTFDMVDNIVPVTVNFSNKSTNSSSYLWDFGDGVNTADKTPSHLYTVAGDYNVTLVAFSNLGADSITKTLTFINPPINIFLIQGGGGAGGIDFRDPISKMKSVLGNADEEQRVANGGRYYWIFSYHSKGLQIQTALISEEEYASSTKIQVIRIKSPYKGVTDKNIGIGSLKADVEAVYGQRDDKINTLYRYYSLNCAFTYSSSRVETIEIGQ